MMKSYEVQVMTIHQTRELETIEVEAPDEETAMKLAEEEAYALYGKAQGFYAEADADNVVRVS